MVKALRTLSESRPRCPLEGLAKSARIHLRKNHRSTWSKHYLLCPGHRQPRTAYGNHLGSAQNCAHPAAGIAAPARVEAINCDGCWRRTTQSFHVLVHVAARRTQNRSGQARNDFPRARQVELIKSYASTVDAWPMIPSGICSCQTTGRQQTRFSGPQILSTRS